jgi:hypothetical protein
MAHRTGMKGVASARMGKTTFADIYAKVLAFDEPPRAVDCLFSQAARREPENGDDDSSERGADSPSSQETQLTPPSAGPLLSVDEFEFKLTRRRSQKKASKRAQTAVDPAPAALLQRPRRDAPVLAEGGCLLLSAVGCPYSQSARLGPEDGDDDSSERGADSPSSQETPPTTPSAGPLLALDEFEVEPPRRRSQKEAGKRCQPEVDPAPVAPSKRPRRAAAVVAAGRYLEGSEREDIAWIKATLSSWDEKVHTI